MFGIGVFRTALTTSLVQWSLGELGWRELDLFAKRGRNGHSQQHYCSPLLIDFFLLIILYLLFLFSLLTLFLLSSLCFSFSPSAPPRPRPGASLGQRSHCLEID